MSRAAKNRSLVRWFTRQRQKADKLDGNARRQIIDEAKARLAAACKRGTPEAGIGNYAAS